MEREVPLQVIQNNTDSDSYNPLSVFETGTPVSKLNTHTRRPSLRVS